ncbi:hypothetical protein BKA62DRAFT_728462 [Auriculariales sp. MPI-PUGE-AT-0066]|nr:hypothetical protein BKA62DRAFT_728462 [Auriculariales sp. MPI-PUGE-AT-0066]
MSLGEYRGEEKLVIGMDLGTTMSAVSYAHLRDGEEPRVHLIMKWPGQPAAAGDCKVPTLVRYNAEGKALLFGRAAQLNEDNLENTYLAKWFKLWLHPSAMCTEFDMTPPPLPPNVTVKDIYADLLAFLFTHTRECLEGTIGGSVRDSLWTRFKSTFVLCLAIPNGWDSAQQGVLRKAVVKAGILPLSEAASRLTFVTEAEASVHFAIAHADIGSWLHKDNTFLVTDAGGSTVDTVVYKCTSAWPTLTLAEATSSECVQAGSAIIDQAAVMLNDFEQNAKRAYDGSAGSDDAVVKTGTNLTDRACNVTKGRLRLSNAEMEQIFAGPLNEIANSIDRAVRRAGRGSSKEPLRLLTVGGFAESPKLKLFLKERLAAHNILLITVDEPTKKAASEGAVYWYAKKFVVARAARKSYGVACNLAYESTQPTHAARLHTTYTDASGKMMIPGHFSQLVGKNEVVQNNVSARLPYYSLSPSKPNLSTLRVGLICIDDDKPGDWCKEADGELMPRFERACTLKADLSGIARSLKPQRHEVTNELYWRIEFAVEVFFGQTTLFANVVWEEDGPVTVIASSVN